MEYEKRRRCNTVEDREERLRQIYPHDIQFYKIPPTGQLDLMEFQALGVERRQMLELIEMMSLRVDLKSLEEKKEALESALHKDGYIYSAKLINGQGSSHAETDLRARRRDHVSHFLLRLAYCRDADRRKWFVDAESEYLRMRLASLSHEGVVALLNTGVLDYESVSPEEKERLRKELLASSQNVSSVESTEFFRVPFDRVAGLVRQRRVYVGRGFAYLPFSQLVPLVLSDFATHLRKELEKAAVRFADVEEDQRVAGYLKNLPNAFPDRANVVCSTEVMPIENLDELSKISYPVCMRSLHEALRTNHHLKHHGRMQYGLFIKGIGVKYEDALAFWKAEFTKIMDAQAFEKNYLYYVRHSYGQVGKRVDYAPYGCNKIFDEAPGDGEKYGCPFKHSETKRLEETLASYGLAPSGISAITDLTKKGFYNLACAKYFELTHKSLPEQPIQHPNSYFSQSRRIVARATGRGGGGGGGAEKKSANGDDKDGEDFPEIKDQS